MPFGCGQCIPCRINARRLWSHRIQLEALTHADNCFATFTYDPAHYPEDGSLCPRDLRLFLYRFRKAVRPIRFRYFAVGEYGTQTQRAHYHVAFFGIGMQFQSAMFHTWGKGYVHVGELNKDTASYIAGYVTKKMTSADDARLNGRHPEFCRMSLRPGIGATAIPAVARTLNDTHGASLINRTGDVPATLRHGGKDQPLGRYLKRKLREEMGFENTGAQEKPLQQYKEELQTLREGKNYRTSPQDASDVVEWQRIQQIETRSRIFKKKETL